MTSSPGPPGSPGSPDGPDAPDARTSASPAGDLTLVIDPREGGLRLDQVLALMLGASRSEARRVLARGGVTLDGRAMDPSEKGTFVSAGQKLCVAAFTPEADQRPIPDPDFGLRIVAEGEGWLAVDKPAGVPVHPLSESETGTLLGAVCWHAPEIVGVGEGGLRCGVVHRLDVDTSGVMLFATEEARWHQLRTAFRRHRVHKTYRTLVHGTLEGEGEIAVQMAVRQHRPARVRVVSDGDDGFGRQTRHTRLSWRALANGKVATLVEVRPATGFLHQIRVSLAHLGHPVVGDQAYGAPETRGVTRHLLHAAEIRYADVAARAADAPDFARALDELVPDATAAAD